MTGRYDAILQPDSIDLTRPHLQREGLLRQVEALARARQYVIVGGPPATGKSSLLELLRQKMEKAGDKVVSIDIVNTPSAPDDIFDVLKSHGVTANRDETVQAFQARDRGLWLLIDEAQNGYSARFEPMWSFLFKSIVKYGLKDKLFIVVASTMTRLWECPRCISMPIPTFLPTSPSRKPVRSISYILKDGRVAWRTGAAFAIPS